MGSSTTEAAAFSDGSGARLKAEGAARKAVMGEAEPFRARVATILETYRGTEGASSDEAGAGVKTVITEYLGVVSGNPERPALPPIIGVGSQVDGPVLVTAQGELYARLNGPDGSVQNDPAYPDPLPDDLWIRHQASVMLGVQNALVQGMAAETLAGPGGPA